MKNTIATLVVLISTELAVAQTVVYQQPPLANGGLLQSSWWDPDDSDWDIYSWDSFTLAAPHAITEISWRGGNIYGGTYGGPVINFSVEIYPSIGGGSQPDVVNPPLVAYETGGNAGESYAGVFGGTAMYDYRFTLPSPFQAAANTRYWVYLVAWQHGIPEWGVCKGSGGNGSYFRFVRGLHMYQSAPGDFSMALYSSDAPTFTIDASASPVNAGAVQGAGQYPANAVAAMQANANAGWGFLNWSENGTQVSTANPYTLTVSADRTLVANFVPAYTITTGSLPTNGGSTSGGGAFNSGTSVTVHAIAEPRFSFVNWSEFGTPVSTSPDYTFSAAASRALTANFALDPRGAAFDFDDAPPYTSLPLSLTHNGLTAALSATGSGFSMQLLSAIQIHPVGFAGICIYPNSVFPADLIVDFSQPLTGFSIMYSPQELGCDNSATMRATGYLNGVFVATATATVPVPGTWPTGTLRLESAAPFDQVVVHYDARPPTCQDWGPIFLADNMIAIMAAAAPCPGDLNGDRVVDLSDLSALLSHFGMANGATVADGDLDADGDVDLSDLSRLLSAFGTTC